MVNEPDTYVEVDGVKLAVDDRGRGGVPLLLSHGFTGSRIDFADVIDELATDRRVVAWDHRGHGASTNTGEIDTYTFDQLARDLGALADALDVGTFHLLGHSMGGIVAMTYVVGQRDRVQSLILMDTLARPQHLPPEFIDMMITMARQDGMPRVAERMVEWERQNPRVPADRQAVMLERAEYKLVNADVEAFEGLGRALTDFPSLLEPMSSLRCPTTVIVGENDTGLRAAATELTDAIEGAVEVVIPDAAHSPQDENPAAWLAAIGDHLERAER